MSRQRRYEHIARGNDADVFRHSKAPKSEGESPREGRTVIKSYLQYQETPETRALFEQRYHALRRAYPDLIPQQRLISTQDARGVPYIAIAQEKVNFDARADIIDVVMRTPERLTPQARTQLREYVHHMRNVCTPFVETPLHAPKPHDPILDIVGKYNLVVGTDGKLHYLDTGPLNKQFCAHPAFIYGPLALLDMASGSTITELSANPFYAAVTDAYDVFLPRISSLTEKARTQFMMERLYHQRRQAIQEV